MNMGGAIYMGHGSLSHRGMERILHDHYLKRRPPMSETFEWALDEDVVAVMTLGVPASRHMQIGALPEDPDLVVELNRLWVRDDMPKNTASWFVSQCLHRMPPRIVLSYADTAAGHDGTVYRAANFFYAGWTDMERKTPRFDYLPESGGHTRDAFRKGLGVSSQKVRRRPKAKYWTATGNRSERRRLIAACQWPRLDWREYPVPQEHQQLKIKKGDR